MKLTQARLRQVLHYEPSTGVFTRLVRTSMNTRVGDVAGCTARSGYSQIRVDGKLYYAHRLAWLYMTGEWPREADHVNGVRGDNRWENLRDSDRSLNQQNLHAAQRNSTTGLLGAHPAGKRFVARLYYGGKHHTLGRFASAEEAHDAYVEAKRQHHAGCTI